MGGLRDGGRLAHVRAVMSARADRIAVRRGPGPAGVRRCAGCFSWRPPLPLSSPSPPVAWPLPTPSRRSRRSSRPPPLLRRSCPSACPGRNRPARPDPAPRRRWATCRVCRTTLKNGGTFAGIALDAGQVEMAATVVAVGKQMGITRRGIEIGISVATEQSSLRPEAVNKDWLGLFQQNPVTYTQYRRTEPGGAAWMFYDQLVKQVPGYDTDPRPNYEIGDVVQKTTTGERFAEYQDMATALADQLMDAVSLQQDDVTCAPAPAEQATTGSGLRPGQHHLGRGLLQHRVDDGRTDQGIPAVRGRGLRRRLLPEESGADHAEPAGRPVLRRVPGRHQRGRGRRSSPKFSTACGINPQVMLVTLQKESGLLSAGPTPPRRRYNAAWGWHCPDTGPGGSANCDPAYAGFFNQGYGMAKQWSRYRLDPEQVQLPRRPDGRHPVERRRIRLRLGARHDPEHRDRVAVHLHAVPAERRLAGRLPRHRRRLLRLRQPQLLLHVPQVLRLHRRRHLDHRHLGGAVDRDHGQDPEQPVRLGRARRTDDHRPERRGRRRPRRRVHRTGHALRLGRRRLRCRPEQRLHPRWRRLQQLRQRPSDSTAPG